MNEHRAFSADVKRNILLQLIAKEGAIVMKNEQYDCEQVVVFDGKFFFDYFSPRENMTYEQYEISAEKAWDYAQQFVPAKLDAIARQMNAAGEMPDAGK